MSEEKLPVVKLERLIQVREHAWLGRLADLVSTRKVCETLELPWRDNAFNISCIPAGTYAVKPYRSRRFGECFAFMDEETKPRTSIRIHAGNFPTETRGCVLVGGWTGFVNGSLGVVQSQAALRMLRDVYPDGFSLHIKEK